MPDRTSPPWHLWVTGTATLLWNSMGAMDYVMTQTRNEAYMRQFSEAQLAYIDSFPTWVQATWAISVWFSVLGSLLLLLRTRHAVPVFWISLAALCATMFNNYILANTSFAEVVGPFELLFTAVILAVAVALPYYAKRLRALGVLR